MTKTERIREVEKKLKDWRKLNDRVKEVEKDAAALAFSGGSAGGPVQTSAIADKTYRGAEMLEGIREDERWIDTIDEAMDYLKREYPDLHNIIKGHYGMLYKRGYRKKHAALFEKSFSDSHFISHQVYHSWRHKALDLIEEVAIQNGLHYVTRPYKRTTGG